MTVFSLPKLLNTIVHNGLTTYKKKNSNIPHAAYVDTDDKKGAIFAVREKAHFANGRVKGYVITSKETLHKDADKLSHWTPNIYQRYTYTDESRTYISGFEDANLSQINTFVVDIDTKKHSVNDIMLACLDDSIGEPSIIIETPNGYQVYFILRDPLFISNSNEFRSLVVAKRLADNIKRSLMNVSADPYCNNFGFFRTPHTDNVVWYSDAAYDVQELIDWSMRYDDDAGRTLYAVPHKLSTQSLTQADWFHALLSATDIKGEKGQIGRNNTLFTLALVCFQDGIDKQTAYDMLDVYNTNLRYPLSIFDMRAILNSAYCGKYKGAKKEYVETLLQTYVVGGSEFSVSLGSTYWYKHKKAREDRVRSHYTEWEQDIIDYVTDVYTTDEPFVWRTQKELCEAIGMAQSSLNEVLKKSKRLLKTVIGKGRNAKTGWTTVTLYMTHIMQKERTLKANYRIGINDVAAHYVAQLEPIAGYASLRQILSHRDGPPDIQLSMLRSLDAAG